jgi:hypothetical protein
MADNCKQRTEPLLIDRLRPEEEAAVRTYLVTHGGRLESLADGGYLLHLPPGTIEELNAEDATIAVYTLTFPDQATVNWFRGGRVPHTGMPGRLELGIVVANKRQNPREHRESRIRGTLGPGWFSIE